MKPHTAQDQVLGSASAYSTYSTHAPNFSCMGFQVRMMLDSARRHISHWLAGIPISLSFEAKDTKIRVTEAPHCQLLVSCSRPP